MSRDPPFFTVATATYNRAHTLERVYRALRKQTWRDFEWVIVDDGSTDQTSDLVRQWVEDGTLSIRYFRQRNGGKHVAFNHAVREARGEMTIPLDSDDECIPQALERFHWHWMSIPEEGRNAFAGILCLCRGVGGDVLGGSLPRDTMDGRLFEVVSRLRWSAELWVAFRTSVLREFPFPEYPGERFVAEGLVWNRISRRYLMRFVNEALRIYYDSADSLSRSSVLIRAASPRATLQYYAEAMDLPVRFGLRLRAAINLWRFAIRSGRYRDALRPSVRHPVLSTLGFVPGGLLMAKDEWAIRRDPRQVTEQRVPQ
jgi:glycosyltransferase involved in cell wall biosynthesis